MVLSSANAGAALGNSKILEEMETNRRARAMIIKKRSTPLDPQTDATILWEKLVYPPEDS
ncbi:MAG: hypothetical protein WC455_21880 [Dehalococcoidia bacterium]|jgi:hypothetical protein